MSKLYTLNGDEVVYNGPAHLSWHRLVNQLTADECVAVIDAAKTCPRSSDMLGVYRELNKSALVALATDALRSLPKSTVVIDGLLSAAHIVQRADEQAHAMNCTRLGALRLRIARLAHGEKNGPWETYTRIALGQLKGI